MHDLTLLTVTELGELVASGDITPQQLNDEISRRQTKAKTGTGTLKLTRTAIKEWFRKNNYSISVKLVAFYSLFGIYAEGLESFNEQVSIAMDDLQANYPFDKFLNTESKTQTRVNMFIAPKPLLTGKGLIEMEGVEEELSIKESEGVLEELFVEESEEVLEELSVEESEEVA